jgi:hypothetical protein
MNLLKKLKPQRIEQLVYILTKNKSLPSVPVGFSINGSSIVSRYSPKRKLTEYEMLLDKKTVYSCKIFQKVHFMKVINEYGSLVIGDCFTSSDYRGLSIYPYMLQKVAGEMFEEVEKIFILVSPQNKSSIRGIEKAGFTLLYSVSTIRFGIFYLLTKRQ